MDERNRRDNSRKRGNSRSRARASQKSGNTGLYVGVGICAAAILIGGGILAGRHLFGSVAAETQMETEIRDPNRIHKNVFVDYSSFVKDAELLNLKGMNREEAADALEKAINWHLVIKNANPNLDAFTMPEMEEATTAETAANAEDDSDLNAGTEEVVETSLSKIKIRPTKDRFEVPDLYAASIQNLVNQIFDSVLKSEAEATETESQKAGFSLFPKKKTEASTETSMAADYTLMTQDVSQQISDYVDQLATVWDMKADNGSITSYDEASGEFQFGGTTDGYRIDTEATKQAVLQAIQNGQYSAELSTSGNTVPASSQSAKSQYTVIGQYTTKTTGNQIRNGNIKLAAKALNGTVVKPGQEFSFNGTVGQRSAAKGYGAAPAYNAGEVVDEIGGGICQVSTTLYNAVFRAGLTTSYRRSHTFAPTYVTPGMDATVSWPGPDYKFINNSDHAVGIKAWYSNQSMNVEIYGVRILPEGVSWSLTSEKVKDLPVPEPKIITPDKGKESNGSAGSEWQAYKIITKNGVTTKEKDHYTKYKGHTPQKYKNSETAPVSTETEQPSESKNPDGNDKTESESETKPESKAESKETKETGGPGSSLPEDTKGSSGEIVIGEGPGEN